MKFKLKKLIALGLTLAMTCSALSMPAYALNVVDNPEVSTDGTNSVDSSTFETVDITTDENGNTVIGTDETESETTTPTEGGEETTPPTTEGGGETTIPPTTEGGEETTIPPTTEGGETTTPPTTEGGEETTPPTTEGGETTTPPEVVDPGFGVDPELPEVLPPEGGEVDVTPTPELPEIDNVLVEQMPLPMLMNIIETYDLKSASVPVTAIDSYGNPISGSNIPTEIAPEGNPNDDITQTDVDDYNGRHFEFVQVGVGGERINYIGSIEYEGENLIYYSTDGVTAILLGNETKINIEYIQYFNVFKSGEGEGGTITVPTEKLYITDELEYTVIPTRTWYVESVTINEQLQTVKKNGGTYFISDLSIFKDNTDININVKFTERVDCNVTVTGVENLNFNNPIAVHGTLNIQEFKFTGDAVTGIKINGEEILISNLKGTGLFFPEWKDYYDSPLKLSNGSELQLQYNINTPLGTNPTALTTLKFKIIITDVCEDLDIEISTGSTNLILSELIYNGPNDNHIQLFYNERNYSSGDVTGSKLKPMAPGSKASSVGTNRDFYFYIKLDPGYGNPSLSAEFNEQYFNIKENIVSIEQISGDYTGKEEAIEAGCTHAFIIHRTDTGGIGGLITNGYFTLNSEKVQYNISYVDENGNPAANGTSAFFGDTITLPKANEVEGKAFVNWTGPDGRKYIEGSTFTINEDTYTLAEGDTFKFTANYIDEKNTFKVNHYFENDSGVYEVKYIDIVPIGSITESTTAIGLPVTERDGFAIAGIDINDYYYDELKTENKNIVTIIPGNETQPVAELYYTKKVSVTYEYEVGGEIVSYKIKGLTNETSHKLYTAPISTGQNGTVLYFAGWDVEEDGEDNLYPADYNFKIINTGKKHTTFVATYYTNEFSGYSNGTTLGLKGGKVDSDSIFTGDIQSASGDDGSVYVYGSIDADIVLQDYDEIGFVYSIYNNAPTTVGGFSYSEDNCVYRNILIKNAGEKTLTEATDGTYLFGTRFTENVPNEFIVTPYIVEESGRIIYGTPKVITK